MKKTLNAALGRINAWKSLPIVLLIVVPVLIVRVKFISVAEDAASLWPWPYFGDTRSWWKAMSVVGIGVLMVLHLLSLLATGWRPQHRKLGLCVAAAGAATFVSALLSPFPRTAWLGYTGLYEGAPVLVSYLIAVWYTAECADSRESRRNLARLLGCIGLLESLHGLFEGFGLSFWMTALGRKVLGGGDQEAIFAFAGSNIAYGTVYQPNHYGMLMAMLTALALGMIVSEHNRLWKAFWIVNALAGLGAVVFSNSRTALFICGFIMAAFLLYGAVAMAKGNSSRTRFGAGAYGFIGFLLAVGVLIAGMAAGWIGAGPLGNGVRTLAGRIGATFVPEQDRLLLADELHDGAISLFTPRGVGQLVRRGDRDWTFSWLEKDAQWETLRFVPSPVKGHEAPIPGIADATLRIAGNNDIRLSMGPDTLWYAVLDGELHAVDHKGWVYREKRTADKVSLHGLEKYLGGRGQTWGLGLALVPENPWLGTGPGSFGLAFPNHELLIKQRHLDSLDEDKGHGIWVTFPVQLGILGAAMYLLVWVCALSRRPWRASSFGRALAMALAAYVLGGITNDSTTGVTPIACFLLGLAAAQGLANSAKESDSDSH